MLADWLQELIGIVLFLAYFALPALLSVGFFVFLLMTDGATWQTTFWGRAIKIVFTTLIAAWGIAFFAALKFDPESMFVYFFWPLPTGLATLGISGLNFRKTLNFENVLYAIMFIAGSFILLGPWIFIALRQKGYL